MPYKQLLPNDFLCQIRPSVAAHDDHIHVAYGTMHIRINYQKLELELDPRNGWKCPKCNQWSRLDSEKCQRLCEYGIRAPLLLLTTDDNDETKCMCCVT